MEEMMKMTAAGLPNPCLLHFPPTPQPLTVEGRECKVSRCYQALTVVEQSIMLNPQLVISLSLYLVSTQSATIGTIFQLLYIKKGSMVSCGCGRRVRTTTT